MDLLVVFDGAVRGTRRVAETLGEAAAATGAEVRVASIATATPGDVARAGALLVGCSVKVRVPFGGNRPRPLAEWIRNVAGLEGKPAGAFCSYSFYPVLFADAVARTAETLHRLGEALREQGARVVGTHSFHRRSPAEGAAEFVRSVLQSLPA